MRTFAKAIGAEARPSSEYSENQQNSSAPSSGTRAAIVPKYSSGDIGVDVSALEWDMDFMRKEISKYKRKLNNSFDSVVILHIINSRNYYM